MKNFGLILAFLITYGMFGTGTANALVITDAGSSFITNAGDTLATFNFDLGGASVVSASVTLNDYDQAFEEYADFFLDGVLLGSLDFGFGQTQTFDLTDLSILDDGVAVLTWNLGFYFAGCPCVIPNGGESLSIITAAVPEPSALVLLGMGLLGFGINRRVRRRS